MCSKSSKQETHSIGCWYCRAWRQRCNGPGCAPAPPSPVVTPPLQPVNNHPAQSCGYRINVNWRSSRVWGCAVCQHRAVLM